MGSLSCPVTKNHVAFALSYETLNARVFLRGVAVDCESKGEGRNIYVHLKSERYHLIIKGKPELNFAK